MNDRSGHCSAHQGSAMRTRLTILLLALITPLTLWSQDRKPNVVVFLSDDQGWGDLSIHGNKNLSTPNIDSLAKDGALFERFFVCPVCSPARAEFLNGPYHPNDRCFDEYYGFCSGHWGDYFSPPLRHNNTLVRGDGYTTDDFTNHA